MSDPPLPHGLNNKEQQIIDILTGWRQEAADNNTALLAKLDAIELARSTQVAAIEQARFDQFAAYATFWTDTSTNPYYFEDNTVRDTYLSSIQNILSLILNPTIGNESIFRNIFDMLNLIHTADNSTRMSQLASIDDKLIAIKDCVCNTTTPPDQPCTSPTMAGTPTDVDPSGTQTVEVKMISWDTLPPGADHNSDDFIWVPEVCILHRAGGWAGYSINVFDPTNTYFLDPSGTLTTSGDGWQSMNAFPDTFIVGLPLSLNLNPYAEICAPDNIEPPQDFNFGPLTVGQFPFNADEDCSAHPAGSSPLPAQGPFNGPTIKVEYAAATTASAPGFNNGVIGDLELWVNGSVVEVLTLGSTKTVVVPDGYVFQIKTTEAGQCDWTCHYWGFVVP